LRKYALLLILTLTLTHALFGQLFDYCSLGYNTVTQTDTKGERMQWHEYFLNDSRFSKMKYDHYFSSMPVFTEERRLMRTYGDKKYYAIVLDEPLRDGNLAYYEEEEGYAFDYHREIYRVTDGKLVYVRQGRFESEKIEYTDKGITVNMRRETGRGTERYFLNFYNIPEDQLYDKFMRQFVKSMEKRIYYLDISNNGREKGESFYEKELKRLTRMEKEILKNCLLAKYGYSFQDPTWIDFMKKYKYYTNGTLSMVAALEKFNYDERKLFGLIQKQLTNKYFVIGDYYKAKDNLRLRDRAGASGNVLTTIKANGWVRILEEGNTETIDGITSVWVKVKLLNNTEGWCFGGYLGY